MTLEEELKITVNSEKAQDNKVVAKVVVDAKDVNAAIKKAYKEIANKYSFQGFRKGKTPRPVIDGIVGRDAVMAEATNDLIANMEPAMVEELNIVPLGDVDYGEDAPLVVEGKDYEVEATITVRPECELENYDAPEINMPPAEATDAEIDEQIKTLQNYHTTFEEIEEDRGVEAEDICDAKIENVENGESLENEHALISMAMQTVPAEIIDAVAGMKKGETKEVTVELPAEEGEEPVKATVKVTVNSIREKKTPELTDEFVKEAFQFDGIEALRDAIKIEIEKDKERTLPSLKEDRLVAEIAKRLKLEETPKEYVEQVFQEIAQEFLANLQRQGMTLDNFLQMRRISVQQFMDDLHVQAEEHARQSLALDALAAKLKVEATAEDIKAEFERAQLPNIEETLKSFKEAGQLPAIRESIKRSKALNWLVDNAKVTEVDEIAERQNKENKDAE